MHLPSPSALDESAAEADATTVRAARRQLGEEPARPPRRGAPLSRRLLLLVGAIGVPLTLLTGGMLWLEHQSDRARAEAALVEQARSLARLVDREFERAEGVALPLAASPALARGDLAGFDAQLRATVERLSASLPGGVTDKLAFFDAEGRRRVYTGWPAEETRLGAIGLPYVVAAIAEGRTQYSDLIIKPASVFLRIPPPVPR